MVAGVKVLDSQNTAPGADAFAITPSDSANLAQVVRALYVGVTGNLTLITIAGNSVVFTNVPAGAIIPVQTQQVMNTGTTASGIVGIV
jgi:hypothetical protein